MKKLLTRLVPFLVIVLVISTVVPAASTSNNSAINPEAALEKYLTVVKEQDIDKMLAYSDDERNMSVEEYKEIFEYEKLLEYKILESESKNENLYHFVIETTYAGGLVTQGPVQLKKKDSSWIVSITTETLTSEDNKVVDHGEDEYFQKIFSKKENNDVKTIEKENNVIKPMDVLLTWNFGDRVAVDLK